MKLHCSIRMAIILLCYAMVFFPSEFVCEATDDVDHPTSEVVGSVVCGTLGAAHAAAQKISLLDVWAGVSSLDPL